MFFLLVCIIVLQFLDTTMNAALSINELEGSVVFPSQQISANLSLKGVVLSVGGDFVLTPWAFTCNVNVTNESWTPGSIYR